MLDFALVDKDDAIGDFKGFVLIVGYEEAGQMGGVVEAAQPVAQFFSDLGIEGTEGFVEQEDFRFDSQSAGEGDTLPLTSGELAGKALSELGELNGLEELLDAGADLRFGRDAGFSFAPGGQKRCFQRRSNAERARNAERRSPPCAGRRFGK